MARKPKPPPPKPVELHWRWHYEPETRRVWRNDWFGDQFEIVDEARWRQIQQVCVIFSLPLIQQED